MGGFSSPFAHSSPLTGAAFEPLRGKWLGWGAPDPGGDHYNAMVNATREAVAMLLPGMASAEALDSVYVWVGTPSREWEAALRTRRVAAPRTLHTPPTWPCEAGSNIDSLRCACARAAWQISAALPKSTVACR